MVLGGRPPGRVGRRRIYSLNNPRFLTESGVVLVYGVITSALASLARLCLNAARAILVAPTAVVDHVAAVIHRDRPAPVAGPDVTMIVRRVGRVEMMTVLGVAVSIVMIVRRAVRGVMMTVQHVGRVVMMTGRVVASVEMMTVLGVAVLTVMIVRRVGRVVMMIVRRVGRVVMMTARVVGSVVMMTVRGAAVSTARTTEQPRSAARTRSVRVPVVVAQRARCPGRRSVNAKNGSTRARHGRRDARLVSVQRGQVGHRRAVARKCALSTRSLKSSNAQSVPVLRFVP